MANEHAAEADEEAFSRRTFLRSASGLAAGSAVGAAALSQVPIRQEIEKRKEALRIAGPVTITLKVNGQDREVEVEPRTTLLSVLRTRLDPPLTGAKEVCDRGACGACTVLLADKPVYSCMQLALDCTERAITTVEGLGGPGTLSPVQQAFWEEDALMCGFCTPGFVVSVTACLRKNTAATLDELREACAGNLCRCGTYPNVFKAAVKAARAMGGEKR